MKALELPSPDWPWASVLRVHIPDGDRQTLVDVSSLLSPPSHSIPMGRWKGRRGGPAPSPAILMLGTRAHSREDDRPTLVWQANAGLKFLALGSGTQLPRLQGGQRLLFTNTEPLDCSDLWEVTLCGSETYGKEIFFFNLPHTCRWNLFSPDITRIYLP